MPEKLRIKDVMTKPRTAVAVLLAGLALAGCGNTKSTEDNPLGTCGHNDYSMEEGFSPAPSKAVAIAKEDVLILHRRAIQAGGSIDLPRYEGKYNTTEITASPDELTLNFARPADGNSPNTAVDHINFPIKDQTPQISIGAVMCYTSSHNQLVVNGTFQTLRQYVNQTASLDK